jgi:hypothetical protein
MNSNEDKARMYDTYIAESDRLQRENSRIKSDNISTMTPELEAIIRENESKIAFCVKKLENLFR